MLDRYPMKRRVYILDAEESSRQAMESLLARRGFSVAASDRWSDAEEVLSRDEWDLLMADPLPHEDRTALLVRLHVRRPVLPIFLVTAFGTHEREVARLRPVCRYIFEKPVDVGAIDRAIQEVFAAS